MGIAGGYLIYLAYELLKSLLDNIPTTMPRWVAILAITGFTGIGIALVIQAFRIWKKGREDNDNNPVDISEQEQKQGADQDSSEK